MRFTELTEVFRCKKRRQLTRKVSAGLHNRGNKEPSPLPQLFTGAYE